MYRPYTDKNLTLKTYKNKNFVRDYDCMNVLYIQTNIEPDLNIYVEVDENELVDSNCDYLFTEEETKNGTVIWTNKWGYL